MARVLFGAKLLNEKDVIGFYDFVIERDGVDKFGKDLLANLVETGATDEAIGRCYVFFYGNPDKQKVLDWIPSLVW